MKAEETTGVLQRQIARQTQLLEQLRADLEAAEARTALDGAELRARAEQIASLQAALRGAEDRLAAQGAEIQGLMQREAALLVSTSWRITRPLRAVSGWLGRLRG